MDALSRAFADADRIRTAARKAAGAGGLLTSGAGRISSQPSLSRAVDQYEHGSKGWAYVAVRAIAQRIAGQDVFAAKLTDTRQQRRKLTLPDSMKAFGDRLEPLATHPILQAIDRPNPLMVRWPLMYFTVANLELTGRAFWWWADGEIWPLPSSWVEPSDNLRTSWKVRPTGVVEPFDVPGDDIAHFCLPDPANPFGSLSPLQSQASAVATDESIQQAQHRSFTNGNFPQLMIRAGRLPGMLPGQDGERPILEPEQRKELIGAIKSIYRGAVNSSEPLIIDGMIEGVERLSDKPGEMDFMESGKAVKSRILQAFGVNPMIVGEIEGANRAQAVVAEQTFCQFTINPLIDLMSQTLTAWSQLAFGESLAVWIAPCIAHDAELELQRWETAAKLGYVSQNEFRRQLLNLPDVDGGDDFRDPLTGKPRERSINHNGRMLEPSRNGRH